MNWSRRFLSTLRSAANSGSFHVILRRVNRLHVDRLNNAQRIVVWLGGALLLLAVLYPEFTTGYDPFINGKQSGIEIGVATKREFILDGLAPSQAGEMSAEINPELRRLLQNEEDRQRMFMHFSRLKVWDLCLQEFAIFAITVGGLWAVGNRSSNANIA
jgi:hypothetical protein